MPTTKIIALHLQDEQSGIDAAPVDLKNAVAKLTLDPSCLSHFQTENEPQELLAQPPKASVSHNAPKDADSLKAGEACAQGHCHVAPLEPNDATKRVRVALMVLEKQPAR